PRPAPGPGVGRAFPPDPEDTWPGRRARPTGRSPARSTIAPDRSWAGPEGRRRTSARRGPCGGRGHEGAAGRPHPGRGGAGAARPGGAGAAAGAGHPKGARGGAAGRLSEHPPPARRRAAALPRPQRRLPDHGRLRRRGGLRGAAQRAGRPLPRQLPRRGRPPRARARRPARLVGLFALAGPRPGGGPAAGPPPAAPGPGPARGGGGGVSRRVLMGRPRGRAAARAAPRVDPLSPGLSYASEPAWADVWAKTDYAANGLALPERGARLLRIARLNSGPSHV